MKSFVVFLPLIAAFAMAPAHALDVQVTGEPKLSGGSVFATIEMDYGGNSYYSVPLPVLITFGSAASQINQIAYCVDIAQDVDIGARYSDYTLTSTGSGQGFSTQQADMLGRLLTVAGTVDTAQKAMAVQLATWEIMYDSASPAFGSGSFYVPKPAKGSNQDVFNLSAGYLSQLGSVSSAFVVTKLSSPTAQDLMVFSAVSAVPEPSQAWMLGCGGLLLVAALRRGARRAV